MRWRMRRSLTGWTAPDRWRPTEIRRRLSSRVRPRRCQCRAPRARAWPAERLEGQRLDAVGHDEDRDGHVLGLEVGGRRWTITVQEVDLPITVALPPASIGTRFR